MTTQAIETQKTKLCINALSLTVAVSFVASTHKIIRATGSWITDGIAVGQVLSTDAAGNKGPFLVSAVTSTDITIDTTADTKQGFAIATTDLTAASHIIKAGTWVKEMTTFSGLDGEASDVDVTSMDSTAKEFLSGLGDNGSFKGDFNYVSDDVGQLAMLAAIASRARTAFHLRMSNNEIIMFDAHVKGRSLSGGVDSKAATSFSMRITGDVTYVSKWVTGA